MLTKTIINIGIGLLLLTFACNQSFDDSNVATTEGFKKSSDIPNAIASIDLKIDSLGKMSVNYFRLSGNDLPKEGEIVEFAFAIKTASDSLIIDRTKGNLMPVLCDSTMKIPTGRFYLLSKLALGDSAVIVATSKQVFGQAPPGLKLEDTVYFHASAVKKYDSEKEYAIATFDERLQTVLENSSEQIAKDNEIIENYLTSKNLKAEKTKNGVYYIIENEVPDGLKPNPMDQLKVDYTLSNLDGKVIDTSIEEVAKENDKFTEGRPYEPLPLTLMQGQVIPGWDEGLGYFRKGESGKLIIPSSLAYGNRQTGPDINPNEILVFDISIKDVIPSEK